MIQAISCAGGVSAANSQCSALRLPVGGYAARFCRLPTSGARISPGVIRSGLPPYSGLIWPDLARFISSRELETRPGVALVWPWLRIRGRGWEWPGVANFYFASISFHFDPFPIVYAGRGCEVPAFVRTTIGIRCNDLCNHGRGWRSYGARGICRWLSEG